MLACESLHSQACPEPWLFIGYGALMMAGMCFTAAGHGGLARCPLLFVPQSGLLRHAAMSATPGDRLAAASAHVSQLAGTMSDRGRRIVASFLALDLGLDWRCGATWYMHASPCLSAHTAASPCCPPLQPRHSTESII